MAKKKISEMSDAEVAELEEDMNTIAKHQLKRKLLADILVDMTIARDIRHTDPMEYPNMIKSEIDRIVEQWKQNGHATDASISTTDSSAKKSTEGNTEIRV